MNALKASTIAAAISAALAMPVAASAADCADAFDFKPDDRLSIQDVSSLVDSAVGDGPADTVLVMTPTDWESPPVRGGWELLAVVYGAKVGVGGQVVGGTLWTRRREAFGVDGGGAFRLAKDGVYLTIRPQTPVKGCQPDYVFKLDPRGVLFANGVRVGQARAGE